MLKLQLSPVSMSGPQGGVIEAVSLLWLFQPDWGALFCRQEVSSPGDPQDHTGEKRESKYLFLLQSEGNG